ncbi:PMT family glycosyltransferase, 4-amino-4-deoxy-L-arabinose transferase [Singulisphaera acidiphila DSM 18658]|uniref:PMT family glycosyltransferase, 4-amino-4-deoxy-L-arabinose transferase n=1 Tax=Singulisphaera acidiphila (strain ATCC BAA-1392 / DSM 18658 / VKM B-2454 / MOB10) TaxID=886293 RepID=L0DCK3_SINAD|nr:PMT family glycosyltransferase, 4-amino-4-deoxy-L-arabinose transferase [Singulisphaera acidiphila DSM 18658]
MGEPSPVISERARTANFWSVGRLAVVAAVGAGLAVVLTLGGPGITIDEPLDVRPGRTYIATLQAKGWRFFTSEVVEAVFRDNAEHPPLGRWLLGLASTLGAPLEIVMMGGPDPVGLYLHAARLAPALAFAILIGLVVHASGRRQGRVAGLAAGVALLLMPRVFAHAHLGALDTFICLFWVNALLRAERGLEHPRAPLAMAGAGLAFGLALLTKIHAWFLPPILFVWALTRVKLTRALVLLAIWGGSGLTLFVLGWPWLWYHSLDRLRAYWGTGVERATLRVLYFGQVYLDRDVPWHYPWFYFAATVPIGLHLFGFLGLAHGWRHRRHDPFPLLLAGSIVFFLVLFSTRIPVYDGERLFLLVFPLWAILIGRGFAVAWHHRPRQTWLRGLLGLFLLAQGTGMVTTHPFGLSYYNALVGGLPGAERLGLELTYWNDAVDRVLLDRLVREAGPEGSAALAPTLYPGQGIASTTRAMSQRPVLLRDEDAALQAEWVVVSRRTAYWRPELRSRLSQSRPVFSQGRHGVWLSAIWHFPPPAPHPLANRAPARSRP